MKKYIIFLLAIFALPLSGCTIDYTAYFANFGDNILGGQTSPGQTPPPPGEDPFQGGTTNPGTSTNPGGTTNPGAGTTPGGTTNPGTGTTPDAGGTVNPPSGGQTLTLMSEVIPDGVLSYPNSNASLIAERGEYYKYATGSYSVYSSYYSSKYDTLYIAYTKDGSNAQTLDARDLALIEEHILYYFNSDATKSEYKDYIKVIRIYSDYASSACRTWNDPNYAQIMGCADYDQVSAEINLNGVTSMDDFLNDNYGYQPKRDTFAHEYGHVSTYYHMILKNRGSYEEYLKIRLGSQYNIIYPNGLLTEYDSDDTYYIQPAEILADDYVDMYYDVSAKAATDKNDYDIEYEDTRNSLTGTLAVKDLNDDAILYARVKAYYDNYLNNQETIFETPKVVQVNGSAYGTIKGVRDGSSVLTLSNTKVIAIAEVVINGLTYYKIILSNVVKDSETSGDLRDYTKNVGYVLKSNCTNGSGTVLRFTRFDGEPIGTQYYIPLKSSNIPGLPYPINLFPYYEFGYFIETSGKLELYNLYDSSFEIQKFSSSQFK